MYNVLSEYKGALRNSCHSCSSPTMVAPPSVPIVTTGCTHLHSHQRFTLCIFTNDLSLHSPIKTSHIHKQNTYLDCNLYIPNFNTGALIKHVVLYYYGILSQFNRTVTVEAYRCQCFDNQAYIVNLACLLFKYLLT